MYGRFQNLAHGDDKQQLDWFKRQLFGEKSEKRPLLDPAVQADWLRRLSESRPEQETPVTEEICYTRCKA